MTRPLARLRTAVVGVAVGAVTLTGCSVYDAPLPGGPDAGDDPITVTARFRDVLDLVPQSTVKLDDVNVGKITGVSLDGYVAEVTMKIRRDAEIPDDVSAQIRQTSLLGEKFVSLEVPSDASTSMLADNAVIGLDRTGRNPEIEEVFSALALLLNGGGVGQLKSITEELNLALGGREDTVRSVLSQIETFMGTLDQNRDAIIAALENTNRLAEQARAQTGTIEAALDDVPGALRSLDRQRADLVKLLQALDRLSGVGTRVIRASKDATIASLTDLAPVLREFADSGQNLPKAINVYLTYPFVDEAVGRDPQVARNLHMGDYTNLSVELDLDIANLPLQELVCNELQVATDAVQAGFASNPITQLLGQLPTLPGAPTPAQAQQAIQQSVIDEVVRQIGDACQALPITEIQKLIAGALAQLLTTRGLPTTQIVDLVDGILRGITSRNPIFGGSGSGSGSGSGGGLGGLLGGSGSSSSGSGSTSGGSGGSSSGGGLLGGVLNRTAPQYGANQIDPFGLAAYGLDPGIGTMLFQGVATNR